MVRVPARELRVKLPDEVRQWFARRYASLHRQWLLAALDGPAGQPWQLAVTLGIPTEAAALTQPQAVRAWADAWRHWRGPGQLAWSERRWKTLGAQQLPASLLLDDLDAAAGWIGERDRWQRALARGRHLLLRWPPLRTTLPRLFDTLADYADTDFQRLQDVLDWLHTHDAAGLYPRQLPLAGMDSKWFEARSGVLALLLAALRGDDVATTATATATAAAAAAAATDATTFNAENAANAYPAAAAKTLSDIYTLAGLRRPPALVRLRILDPALRAAVGGLGDLAAPVEMVAALPWQPAVVLIVENLQTGLALPDLPGAVAVMGLGYAVGHLAGVPWLAHARCLYWGDIDTHGYAILHRARIAIPHLESLLMDEETLLRFAPLWAHEAAPAAAEALSALTADEHAMYDGLRSQRWGQAVRLEQERIAWNVAWQAILTSSRAPNPPLPHP